MRGGGKPTASCTGCHPLRTIGSRIAFALIALVLLATDAHAAPFDLAGRDWEGCRDLVELATTELGPTHVVTTNDLDVHALQHEDGVILLHPEQALDVEALAEFMRQGGRVILLDDYGTGDALLAHFGMRRVPSPLHPAEMLRKNPALPIAEPASSHPVVAEVSRVMTNHPTGIAHPDLSPILKIRSNDGTDVLLAVAGAVGQGRLLAVGDPSIVMNAMMRYPGNKAFAHGMIHYAIESDSWGNRGGKLYILSGAFKMHGTVGDAETRDPVGARMHALMDALRSVRHDGLSNAATYALAVMIGLAIVVWVGARAGRVHKPETPRFTRPLPAIAQGGVAGHAAVLANPGTSRVLAMLEWKSALEEELCAILKWDALPTHEVLFAELSQKRLLDPEGIRSLKELFLRLSSVETIALSQRGAPLPATSDREVLKVAASVERIVNQVRVNRNREVPAS